MSGINKVILIGNVGKDPEQKSLSGGGTVVNINIATSETWKDKSSGQPQEKTEWHRIVFFNRLAEIVAEYVKKGSKLYVEGALRTRSWEQDGVTKYATEIICSEMQMLDSRGGVGSSYADTETGLGKTTKQPSQQPRKGYPSVGVDDDIPF